MESKIKFRDRFGTQLTVIVGIVLGVVIVYAMYRFSFEIGIAILAGTGVFVATSLARIFYFVLDKNLDHLIKKENLNRIRNETERDKLFVLRLNERAINIYDRSIIDGHYRDVISQPLLSAETPTRKLLDVEFIHMLIVGPTNIGKTTVENHLIDNFPADAVIYVLDPHEKFNEWSDRAVIVGKGRNFQVIDDTLAGLLAEMNQRYVSSETRFQKIVIVCDEWLSIAKHCPNSTEFFDTIGSEARKVNMHLIISTISSTVRDLGIEGSGQLRENFVQLTLNRTLKTQNLGELKWSKEETELVELPGVYYQQAGHFRQYYQLAEPEVDELELEMDRIYRETNSLRAVCRDVLDIPQEKIGIQHTDKVKKILAKFGHHF